MLLTLFLTLLPHPESEVWVTLCPDLQQFSPFCLPPPFYVINQQVALDAFLVDIRQRERVLGKSLDKFKAMIAVNYWKIFWFQKVTNECQRLVGLEVCGSEGHTRHSPVLFSLPWLTTMNSQATRAQIRASRLQVLGRFSEGEKS